MQKVYLLNVTLTVLILTLSFFTGTLLAQTTGTVFHRAEEIKSGIFGSDLNETGTYTFPGWVTLDGVGAKLKVGASDISSTGLTVNGSSLVVDPTTGNVGIGTTSPGEKLEVKGNIKLSGDAPTYKITNVAAPIADSDVATKGWVLANSGGLAFEIQGKRIDTGAWEKIDDFGYWGPNGPMNPNGDEYKMSGGTIYKNGAYYSQTTATYASPRIGGYLMGVGAADQYCKCVGNLGAHSWEISYTYTEYVCTTADAPCSCRYYTAPGETGYPYMSTLVCDTKTYGGLRVR